MPPRHTTINPKVDKAKDDLLKSKQNMSPLTGSLESLAVQQNNYKNSLVEVKKEGDKLASKEAVAKALWAQYREKVRIFKEKGMEAYREWATVMLEIIKLNQDMGKAIRASRGIWWIKAKHFGSKVMPYVTGWNITLLKKWLWNGNFKPWLESKGVLEKDAAGLPLVNMGYQLEFDPKTNKIKATPTMEGHPVREYYQKNRKVFKTNDEFNKALETATQLDESFKLAWGVWLLENGYEIQQDGTVLSTDGANTPLTKDKFDELNVNNTFDDFMTGEFDAEVKISPKISG